MCNAISIYNTSITKKKSSNYIIPAHFFKSIKEKTTVIAEEKTVIKQVAQKVELPSSENKITTVRRRKQSALSLKKIQNRLSDIEISSVDEDLSNKPKDPFTQEQLVQKWNHYGQELLQSGQTSLASVINASKPILNNNNIMFTLPTKLMEEQFFNAKPQLLNYLRTSFNNYGFQIETKVEVTEKKKYIYSPHEKFQKLAELNPNVLKLKKTFGLDF